LGETRPRGRHARLLLILVNLLSFACLVWTLRDARLGDLKDDLATMDWKWVAIAVIADIGVYCWQAWRWSTVLRPVVRVKYWQTVRAIYVGLFANEVLPFRAGELLRCYLLAQWTEPLPLSVSLSSALIERIFDGIWLCLCLVLMLHYLPLPRQFQYLEDAGYVLGLLVLAAAVLLGVAMLGRRRSLERPTQGGWRWHLAVLIDDLRLMGHSRYLFLAFLQSLPYLLLQVIPIWAAFKGYTFDLSLFVGFSLMVILRMGSVVPQAPGNLGLFQFLTKEGLQRIFNVVPAEAARFSLVLWGVVTLPLLIGGFIALSSGGKGITELRRAAEHEAAGLKEQI
jgi:glycosyltransferase 2 family protein